MNKIYKFILGIGAALALASCSTPTNIPYFQDVTNGSTDSIAVSKTIRIRPGDKVSIIVNSQSPKISLMFNLAYATRYVGTVSEDAIASSQSTGVQGYAVSEDGTIDFPVLGRLYIADMTRDEIARMIKNRLVEEGLVQDPIVTVEYLNLKVSVLGEVARPGRVSIDRDEYTILDALSAAGDLTIYGKRNNVLLIREDATGEKSVHRINLNDANLINSPYYYLQQNDYLYVEPNSVQAKNSSIGQSITIWFSVVSVLTSIASLMVNVLK